MVGRVELDDVKRRLEVIRHELDDYASERPANGAEVTLAMRNVQMAGWYVGEAKQKEV